MVAAVFHDDDAGYVRWVAENPAGYILNIQRGLSAGDARVHTAACRHVTRAIEASASGNRRLTITYIKVCSSYATELDEWSIQRVGVEIRRCPSCNDVGRASSEEPSVSLDNVVVVQPDRPEPPYRVTASAHEVYMEGPRHLPFERLDHDQREARAILRGALARLSAESGQVLHAWFAGPKPPNSDVENLVLYNVDAGGASLIDACCFGVRFELDSQNYESGASCRYRYRLVPSTEPLSSWRLGPRLVRFVGVDLGEFGPRHRLAKTWMAIHNAPAEVEQQLTPIDGAFGVFLDLEAPASVSGIKPELVKPLVDGVICAFQAHLDESTVTDMASRIANDIQAAQEKVSKYLLAADRAVLGARLRLVHQRGAGVQWSPSDHLCVAGQVLHTAGDRWRLSGAIHALAQAGPSDGHQPF